MEGKRGNEKGQKGNEKEARGKGKGGRGKGKNTKKIKNKKTVSNMLKKTLGDQNSPLLLLY